MMIDGPDVDEKLPDEKVLRRGGFAPRTEIVEEDTLYKHPAPGTPARPRQKLWTGSVRMPMRGKRLCSRCNKIVDGDHNHRGDDVGRGSANERGYDYKWQKASRRFLKDHLWCVMCLAHNHYTPATVVHHVKTEQGDPILFNDKSNWQALALDTIIGKRRPESNRVVVVGVYMEGQVKPLTAICL